MVLPSWYAWILRAEKERPSRTRSTPKVMGSSMSPPRRKYACREWMARPGSTVRMAAIAAWASTCPPYTRARGW